MNGEIAHFQMTYKVIPDYNQRTGYAEVRRVLNPAGTRLHESAPCARWVMKGPNPTKWRSVSVPILDQLLKFGYTLVHYTLASDPPDHLVTIQFVTNFKAFGFAGR